MKKLDIAQYHCPLSNILIAMFGMPAAFGVIAKIDERLDLAPLLERVVLGFDLISKEIWKVISRVVDVDLSQFHHALTFLLLITCAAASQALRDRFLSIFETRDKESQLTYNIDV